MGNKFILLSIIMPVILTGCTGTATNTSVDSTYKSSIVENEVTAVASATSSYEDIVAKETEPENDSFVEEITKENIIETVAADYNGTNEYFDNITCEVNTDAVIYEINWQQAIKLYERSYNSIIMFSAPWCPFCQASMTPITNAAASTNTPIFYVNAEKYKRPTYSLNRYEDGRYETYISEPGAEGYSEFVDMIKEKNLEVPLYKVVLNDDKGNSYDTDFEKISIPTTVMIKGDKMVAFGCDESVYDSSDGIDEKEQERLTNALVDFMNGLN